MLVDQSRQNGFMRIADSSRLSVISSLANFSRIAKFSRLADLSKLAFPSSLQGYEIFKSKLNGPFRAS
jgi:hypothetical protein